MFCLPLSPFEFANGFRFTAIPFLHELHCLVCIPLPFYVFANGFRFTAIPFIFDCMSSTRPTFKAFWTSEGPKCPQNGLKMGLFHPFVHPKWSRMRSGKMRF